MLKVQYILAIYFLASIIKYTLMKYLMQITCKGRPDSVEDSTFRHPGVILFTVNFVQSFLLLVYLGLRKSSSHLLIETDDPIEQSETSQFKSKVFQPVFLATSLFNSTGSFLNLLGMSYLDLSLAVILSGMCTAITGLLNVLVLKRTLDFNKKTGIFVITVGGLIAGMAEYFHSHSLDQFTTNWKVIGGLLFFKLIPIFNFFKGMFLCLGSDFFHSVTGVFQELYLKDRNVHPLHGVGMEGLFETIWQTLGIVAFSFLHNGYDHGYVEDVGDAIAKMYNCPSIVGILCMIIYFFFLFYIKLPFQFYPF